MQSTLRPLVVESLIDQDLCLKLLRIFAAQTPVPRSYQGMVDRNVRNCDYVTVPNALASAVNVRIAEQVDQHYNTTIQPVPDQPTLIYRYGKGVGFDLHHDEVTDVEVARAQENGQPVIGGDITAVLFLNDPDQYFGGELYFQLPVDFEVRPPAGTLVSFPATREYLHGVRPIQDGERYTLLARYRADGLGR